MSEMHLILDSDTLKPKALNTKREDRDRWVKEGYGLRAPLAADVNLLEDELKKQNEQMDKWANIGFCMEGQCMEFAAWIQRAKALLFDCTFSVDSDGLRKEIDALIDEGGGYDPAEETSRSRLRWEKEST